MSTGPGVEPAEEPAAPAEGEPEGENPKKETQTKTIGRRHFPFEIQSA